jgi:Ca2+-dependent lipid-binding protein
MQRPGFVRAQLWGTSDPYCILTVSDSARRSRVVPRTLNPVWDEHFQLYVRCAPALHVFSFSLSILNAGGRVLFDT